MLAVRTPGAPLTARVVAARGSAFPFERQGRLLRSRSISGLFSRSLHSGLQPPCLRFATAVTGRHARLGSRLLARLCRGRHLRRQTSTRLQGATPTPPYIRVRIRRFAGLSGKSCSVAAVVWVSAIVAPASTPLISVSQGFTPSRRSEASCPEFSRMADAISLHLLVTSSVQAFGETRSAYYALC
ncbi:hypothetical protein ACVIYL_000125 [Bradyrhizobium sp. USDA 3315]